MMVELRRDYCYAIRHIFSYSLFLFNGFLSNSFIFSRGKFLSQYNLSYTSGLLLLYDFS